MQRAQSIKVRLALVFLFFFFLVIVMGLESLRSVSYVNDVAAQIRDRWLPGTRALGDLNNFTTDFPAAEEALRRNDDAAERARIARQLHDLDIGIARAEQAYRQLAHDASEARAFLQFQAVWADYRRAVTDIQRSAKDSLPVRGDSHDEVSAAYARASDALGVLTEQNERSARRASELSNMAYTEARRRILSTILLAGLGVGLAMMYVRRSLSAPLIGLADRMHRLADNDTALDVGGTGRRDEIGEMARAVVVFRNNATDLARSRFELSQQAAILREKLAEEQAVTRLQRNFVSMASHEFRTPLGIIDGHAQRMISLRERLTAAETNERARKIRRAVHEMTQLIDDLIGSARLLDGPLDLNFQATTVELSPILEEVCGLQRELSPDATIESRIGRLPACRGDPRLLRQLFGNLMSNAVKYSPPGSRVMLTAEADGDVVVVTVLDRGIGIPDQDQARMFERYFRGSNTAGIAGSGVGLYLVRKIVDLHGGAVEAISREGEGSRFVIRMPIEATSAALPA